MRRSLRLFLLLLLPLLGRAQSKEGGSQAPALANKQLFDRTIDELNFRTFEAVYDKHYTRQKYPPSLRSAAARRQFAGFEGNAELQKLFANYNGVAERYKLRFGGGSLTQVEFDKQLGSVLRDRNFEFFIRGLPRDERSALIRTEQRLIRQATAQFNASGSATPPAEPEPEEPLAPAAPLTTHDPTPPARTNRAASPDASSSPPAAASPGSDYEAPLTSNPELRAASGGPGWTGYLTLLLSLGSFGLLLYLVASLLPELYQLRRRVRTLEGTAYPEEADEAEPGAAAPRPPSLLSRLRPQRTNELPTDHYDEDEDEPEGDQADESYSRH